MGEEKVETLESDGSLLGLVAGLLALLVLVLFSALIFMGLIIRKERSSELYYEETDTHPDHDENSSADDSPIVDNSE